jgi:hypothetical protein
MKQPTSLYILLFIEMEREGKFIQLSVIPEWKVHKINKAEGTGMAETLWLLP